MPTPGAGRSPVPAARASRVVAALVRGQALSAWRMFLGDARYRMAWLIVLTLDAPLGWWGARRLALLASTAAGRGDEALARELGTALLAVWVGIAALALLSARQYIVARQPNDLLFSLPIAPAVRWRALFLQLALGGLGNWGIVAAVALGAGLLPALGPAALAWLLLFLAGGGCAAGLALALLLAWMAGPRPDPPAPGPKGNDRRGRPLWPLAVPASRAPLPRRAVLIAGLLGVAAIPVATGVLLPLTASHWRSSAAAAGLALVFTALLAFLSGPLAAGLGRRYEAAYIQAISQTGAMGRGAAGLVARAAGRLLLPRRSLAAAVLLKEITLRDRHWTNWARLVLVAACAVAYPWLLPPLRDALGAYAPDAVLAVALAAGLIWLTIFDSASSPIGAEGDRINLYLTMPITWPAFLAGRCLVFYLSYAAPGVLLGLFFSALSGLTPAASSTVAIALALMFGGISGVFAWGSAWDAAPDRPSSTGLQAVLEEDAPFTPQRMVLSLAAALLLLGQVALFARVPAPLSLPALAALNALVLAFAWRLGMRCSAIR